MTAHYVGQRLSYDGARCSVRYCGSVSGKSGEWIGVEWDAPHAKGKHDGTYLGKSYFKCLSDSPTAASFVRPDRPSDKMLGFLKAIKAKYGEDLPEIFQEDTDTSISISGKTVQEIGFEKIRRRLAAVQQLQIVILDDLRITGIRDNNHEDILEQWHRIRSQDLKIAHLDLSRNLIEQWTDVVGICSALRQTLRSLILDGNVFCHLKHPKIHEWKDPFPNIRDLSLCSTYLSWREVTHLLPQFPSLNNLRLSSNRLGSIPGCLPAPQLERLDLSSNNITMLKDLDLLASLPRLTRLSLRDNPLESLMGSGIFPGVTFLDLSLTLLPTHDSLLPIPRAFPSLTCLLTTNTPITILPAAELFTIAQLATLTQLNHTPITAKERQNAELYYISTVAKELTAALNDSEERIVISKYPRYEPLCKIHGSPDIVKQKHSKAVEAAAETLAARMIEFTFYITLSDLQLAQTHARLRGSVPTQHLLSHDDSYLTKKSKVIPRTVDIYGLKGIVGRLFGFQPMSCRLVWETGEWDPVGGEADSKWSVNEDVVGNGDVSNGGSEESMDVDGDESNDMSEESMDVEGDESDARSAESMDVEMEMEMETDPKEGLEMRELELADGTREVGFWIEGGEARVRVEYRDGF